MNRRDSVLAVVAMAALGVAGSAGAQPSRPWRIALLPDFRPDSFERGMLSQELRKFGRIEGRDYVFYHSGIYYGGDSQAALDRALGSDPDLILVANLGFAIAARKVTTAIPIVMWASGFPVEGGVAASLSRPGMNVTGLTIYAGGEVFGKLVQLVQESRPGSKRIGVLMSYVPPFHPRAEADVIVRGMQDAASRLGLDLRIFEIAKREQVDEALAKAAAQGVEGLVLTSDPSMAVRMKDILRFAVARRLPTIVDAPWEELGEPQPLLVYMASFPALIRQAAPYVNQILWHGAKPGELPIQLPARFEFVVDLRTAKALGMTVPPSILVRADRVVE